MLIVDWTVLLYSVQLFKNAFKQIPLNLGLKRQLKGFDVLEHRPMCSKQKHVYSFKKTCLLRSKQVPLCSWGLLPGKYVCAA